MAAGRRAIVRDFGMTGDNDGDEGTFIWADSTNADFTSTGPNQFLIRANGGVGIGTGSPSNQLSVQGDADFAGSVGIGTTSPQRLVHVLQGGAGLNPNSNALLVVERNATNVINVLAPDASASGIVFGNPVGGNSAGGVIFNSGATPQGLQFRVGGNVTEMAINSTGNVGINTTSPGFKLEVNGSAGKPGGGTWSVSSDRRLKKNISRLEGSLDKLMQLQGVTYEYIDSQSINELAGQRIGMIAQEVEDVFPDWVDERHDGYKAVTFRGFEALTVEALRELRNEKDEQITRLRSEKDSQIAQLKREQVERDVELATLRADHEDEVLELRDRLEKLERMVTQLAKEEN